MDPVINLDLIEDILIHVDYPTITKICATNRRVAQLCQTNPIIKDIIFRKQWELIQNYSQRKLLIIASRNGFTDIVDKLLIQGYDPNFIYGINETALSAAINYKKFNTAKRLLQDNRTDPNINIESILESLAKNNQSLLIKQR